MAQGSIAAPSEEEVLAAEVREAWFRLVEAAHRGQPKPGVPPRQIYIVTMLRRSTFARLLQRSCRLNGQSFLEMTTAPRPSA